MGAKLTDAWWVDQIQLHWNTGISNEGLHVTLKNLYNRTRRQIKLHGTVPSVSVIQRITRTLKDKKNRRIDELVDEESMYEKIGLERPWHSQRIDQSDISSPVSNWISQEILTNNSIMIYRGLEPFKHGGEYKGRLDAVTRRTALWIATLLERLEAEESLVIWSIAWMYSGYELQCESLGDDFDTREYDYYVATRPWSSFERRRKYLNAVDRGITNGIHRNSPLRADIHEVQIQRVRAARLLTSERGLIEAKPTDDHVGKETWSVDEEDIWMNEAGEVWDEDDLKTDR